MAFMNDYQQRQIRDGELRRFDRWFVETAMGLAYRGRDGRVRGVKAEEVARWRADVEAHVDTMIARAPMQLAWAFGGLFAVIFGGNFLLGLLDIPRDLHSPAIGLALFIVEAVTVGIEAWDYIGGWRERRDGIETAVAARAPLPVDPRYIGSEQNWYRIAMVVLIAAMIMIAYGSHADEGIMAGFTGYLFILGVPLVWGLHFAAKWHDRRSKGRLPG